MYALAKMISLGEANFGSGTTNTEIFNAFYDDFKKTFKKVLKKINATNIKFSKGHFTASGFFTIDGQPMYFSLPDVRNPRHNVEMLVRKVKDYNDFCGGANHFIEIDDNITNKIVKILD